MNSPRTFVLDVIIGDVIYNITVFHYPGCPGGYWEPGDPGETTMANFVEVEFPTGRTDVTTANVMLLDYARYESIALEDAEDHLLDELHRRAQSAFEDWDRPD